MVFRLTPIADSVTDQQATCSNKPPAIACDDGPAVYGEKGYVLSDMIGKFCVKGLCLLKIVGSEDIRIKLLAHVLNET